MRAFHTLSILFAFAFTGAQAQIFINTGNAGVDKYKQDNPNATVVAPGNASAVVVQSTEVSATDSAKVKTAVKTPEVKLKRASESKKALAPPPTPPAAPAPPVTATMHPLKAPKPIAAPAPVAPAAVVSAPAADLPPNAEVGKCYARCYIADKYEMREETVIDKPLLYKTQTIAATFRTTQDTLVVKPASVRYKDIPAVYENTTEDVLVTPATQKWVKSTADAGCLSANPADCQVMCLHEVPAVYKKISRKTIKTPATREEIQVAAEFKVVTRKVIDQPARQEKTEIPATYKTVSHKELVTKGGFSEWREILCANKLTSDKIMAIQKALKANGYDPGAIDNVFGGATKTALIKYQQDKNLPVGNLNMETLKSLGVE